MFSRFKKSISNRLIAYWLLVGLAPLLISSFIFYHFSKEAIIRRSFEQLSSIREVKKMQLHDFFTFQLNLVDVLAESPSVQQALPEFDSAYRQGIQTDAYEAVNARYHPYLQKIKDTYGLYDVFLVNTAGDIIYTVVREPDFATNLIDGPYRDQNIALAFRQGMNGNALVDFDHYAPSQGQPASFVASPVKDPEGQTVGVLIAQIPLDKIDVITQERSGLGESGETYIVGTDYLMRSDSRFSEKSTVLELEVKTKATEAALSGKSGVEIIDDYRGVSVLSSYTLLEIGQVRFALMAEIDEAEILEPVLRLAYLMAAIAGLSVLLISLLAYTLSRGFVVPVLDMKNVITQLAEGMIPDAVPHVEKADELGEMGRAISTMANGYAAKAEFAGQLGEGCFTSAYEAQSEKDILGRALLNMREQLQKNEEENRRRNWSAEGLAGFTTTLRHAQNAEKLGATILSELVQYLGANQAAIFVKTEDEGETYLKMTACYAYGREKHLSKKIYPGEGLAGQVFLEGASLLLTEIPEDYVRITSGLGGARPGCLLIVPLKLNDAIEGVLEIASFRRFEEHEISFIEKLAEHIAASLQHIRINRQTEALLQESRLKTDELQAKEEEMRQNMEELTATQEEMRRKEQTYLSRIAELENRPDGVHP